MATYRAVEGKLAECQRLIDLSSIRRDFERCKNMCDKLKEGSHGSGYDMVEIDALATAITVVYARPYNGGVRTRINELFESFSEEEKGFHRQILEMRSKFAAHSVNRMEQEYVRVWLNPEEKPGGRKINNVNSASNVLLALSGSEYQRLSELCSKSLQWVDHQLDIESKRLPPIILEHFSLDELYEMQDNWVQPAGLESAHVGRTRLDKS